MFQIYQVSLKSLQVIEFIKHLLRHLKRRILIIWDGTAIDRSKKAPACIASTKRKARADLWPAYAPELNPVGYMWAHLNSHQIANLIATEAWELSLVAKAARRKSTTSPPSSQPSAPNLNFGLNVLLLSDSQ